MQNKPVFVFIVALSAVIFASAAVAERSFSSLEERMSGSEFRETGLHKLNDEELAALNRWIRQRSLAEGEIARPGSGEIVGDTPGTSEDRRGFPTTDSGRSTIRARIVGSFDGWQGYSEFELDNGMVWKQTEARTFSMPRTENPQVEIRPGMFGSWRLYVDGYNTFALVERIR